MFVFSDMDDQILTNDIVSDLITCSKAIISAPSPKIKLTFSIKKLILTYRLLIVNLDLLFSFVKILIGRTIFCCLMYWPNGGQGVL